MKSIVRILAVVFLLTFFVPYVSVACMNQKVATVTGVELLIGRDKEIEMSNPFGEDVGETQEGKIEVDIAMTIVVIAALAAIAVFLLFRNNEKEKKYIIVLGIYSIIVILLLLVPVEIKKMIRGDEGYVDGITMKMELGYYISMCIAIAIASLSGYISFYKKAGIIQSNMTQDVNIYKQEPMEQEFLRFDEENVINEKNQE